MSTKKIISFLLAAALLLQPFGAVAADLDGAFTALLGDGSAVSTNAPGKFSSGARTGLSGGGFEMRVPRADVAPVLFSATPPKINAGCNGISAHFGGFSFISGTEFTDLLKKIGSGAAMGFVASLVMKSLCPMCEAVIQELKAAAQMAAKLAKDACSIGESYGRAFMGGESNQGNQENTCARMLSDSGGASDTQESSWSLCRTLVDANKSMSEWDAKASDGQGGVSGAQTANSKAEFQCSVGNGNLTWARLTSMDKEGTFGSISDDANVRKVMLMNLMGADLHHSGDFPDGVGCGDVMLDAKKTQHFCTSKLDTRTLTGIFMCGANLGWTGGAAGAETYTGRIQRYCNTFLPGSDKASAGPVQLWTCDKGDFTACPYLKLADASTVFTGRGFLLQVNELLREAVKRVRDGELGFSDETGQRIVKLVNAAPYPLYQAINAAAVYPAAADDLLDAMSVLVAEQFTHALFEEMLRLEGRSTGTTCITPQQATEILNFIGALRLQNENRTKLMGQNLAVQEAITEQIRQVNQAIQRQVMSTDLLATGKLSQALNGALSPTGSRATAP